MKPLLKSLGFHGYSDFLCRTLMTFDFLFVRLDKGHKECDS